MVILHRHVLVTRIELGGYRPAEYMETLFDGDKYAEELTSAMNVGLWIAAGHSQCV
jgi:hypothetical protein